MTKYLTTSGELITLHEIKKLHPNTSIPTDADLSVLGYTTLISTPKPTPNPWHTVISGPPLNGYETWTQVPDTPEKIRKIVATSIDRYFDQIAISRGYDNRISCAMRAGYVGPWQDECRQFAEWMDASIKAVYDRIEADLSSGAIPPPTNELIDSLPSFTWP